MLKRSLLLAFLVFASLGACALADSPFDPERSNYADWSPVLVDDDVMPSASEIELVRRWTKSAFGGEPFDASPTPDAPLIIVEEQD